MTKMISSNASTKASSLAAPAATILYTFALSHEAKPFYEKLNAKILVSKHGFKLYHANAKDPINSDDNSTSVAILITGSGSNAMSAGLAWAQQFLPNVRVFLNIGIAGHGGLPIGSCFLVSKATDDNSGKCFYPHSSVKKHLGLPLSEILTVSKPSSNYQKTYGYDMEASAFFETGRRFLNAEAVQSIKVVSDSAESDFTQLTPMFVNEIIEKESDLILQYANELLLNSVPNEMQFDNDLMREVASKWNVSVSNQTILRELLCSAALLQSHSAEPFPKPQGSETLKHYLTKAKQWVLAAKPILHASEKGVDNG